jgi:hypothetical membrane protein
LLASLLARAFIHMERMFMAADNTSVKRTKMVRPRYLAAAGALLFFAGVVSLMGIITAEALYPDLYSTAANAISDLGATQPPDSVIHEPSATIFNTVMMVTGVLAMVVSVCLQRGFRRIAAPVMVALFGLGALGVGVFPGDWGNVHAMFAMLTFIAGGLAAIFTFTLETSLFRYFSVVLGVVALATLLIFMILGEDGPLTPLGVGGAERWVAYPIVLWAAGFGGHLMGRAR